MADPVVYCDGSAWADPLYQGNVLEGKYPAGWYFYDETWADWYGPYPNEDTCRQELDRYCREVLGVPKSRIG